MAEPVWQLYRFGKGTTGSHCFLYLLLIYKEAAGLEVNHKQPGNTVIELPGKNGAVTSKPFPQYSMDEMCIAIRRKRKPSSSKPLPKANVALADQYQEAVTRPFSKGMAVKERCAAWSAALEDFFQ